MAIKKVYATNPKHLPTIENLGVVYGILNDYPSSIKYLLMAIDLRPNHAHNYMNIGLTYKNMGDEENAKKYLGLYQEMQESK
jgi:tetratricopeptide (TPR) repeat protein